MSKTRNVTAGTIGSSECSATLGEFTDASGRVRPCRNLGIDPNGPCAGLRRIQYWNHEIGLTTAHILPHEFRPDPRREREQDRLRHMEAHSNDIYGKSPNGQAHPRSVGEQNT